MLNCAGAEAQEIHEQFEFEDENDAKDIDKVLKKFEEYCNPRKSTVYERYKFRCRSQVGEEPVDKWAKDLKSMAVNCEFGEQENSLIRDQIVYGVRDERTKERMLREKDLPLQKALEICRAAESTKNQMREMTRSKDSANVHHVAPAYLNQGRTPTNDNNSNSNNKFSNNNNRFSSSNNNFNFGNNNFNSNDNSGLCYTCGGRGHPSRICPNGDSFPRGRHLGGRGRSNTRGNRGGRRRNHNNRGRGRGNRINNVNEVEEENVNDDYEEEFQSLSLHSLSSEPQERGRTVARGNQHGRSRGHSHGHVSDQERVEEQFQTLTLDSVAVESVVGQKKKRQRFVRFKFHNIKKRTAISGALKVDSGAELNTMPVKQYQRLYPERFTLDGKPIKSYIKPDNNTKLKGYGGNYVSHLGTVTLPCEYNGRKFKCTFYLAEVDGPALMGLPTGEALDIIKINIVNSIVGLDEIVEDVIEGDANDQMSNAEYISPKAPMKDRPFINNKSDLTRIYPECIINN